MSASDRSSWRGYPDDPGETVAAAAAGDERALSAVYRQVHPRVIRYLRVLEPADAERVAAETWGDVVERLDGIDGDARSLYALAFSIAHGRVDRTRPRRGPDASVRPESGDGDAFGAGTDVDDEMAGDGLRAALTAIARLPRDEAEIILLRVLGELSVDDVGRILGKRPRTIHAMQRRALRALEWTMPPTRAMR